MDPASELAAVAAVPDQRARVDKYTEVLRRDFAAADVERIKVFVDHVLTDEVPLIVSRQLFQTLAESLPGLPAESHKAVAEYTLARVQPRVVSFEEQASVVREQLASVWEGEEAWSRAAQVLSTIDLDSGNRVLTDEYKLEKCVKIAQLFLEDDDPVAAEQHIKRASFLIAGCKDAGLELRYKVSHARVLDSKRRFLEASSKYYELSHVHKLDLGGRTVDEAEVEQALAAACTCAILAPAGPQRSRVLATLYKDERCARLPVFPILEKVYLERILQPAEVAAFAEGLPPHMIAVTGDGQTVLERSIVQHNVLAASKLYTNIHCDELGALLRTTGDKAERVAAKMVEEERMKATIDQVERVIHFASEAEELAAWDTQIFNVCLDINTILQEADKKGLLPEMAEGHA